ncbi:RidA family protein [Kaistia sp. MMO-174]|uniref:RidA family protein n=1 Tax=Kaistia sp. MMO-174 TaxID=3081256 RepID=UPI0030169DDC
MTTAINRHNQNHRMSLCVEAGGFVFTAGLTAVRERGNSVTAQATEILERIDKELAGVGTDKTRLVQAQVWLTDIHTFDEFNKVWDAWIADAGKPVRACVEAALADPALNCEIMVTALR